MSELIADEYIRDKYARVKARVCLGLMLDDPKTCDFLTSLSPAQNEAIMLIGLGMAADENIARGATVASAIGRGLGERLGQIFGRRK